MRKLLYRLIEQVQPVYNNLAYMNQDSLAEMQTANHDSRAYKIHARLQATPLDKLASKLRVRSEVQRNLRASGARTAEDVRGWGTERLAGVAGVTAETAQKLVNAADELAVPKLRDIRIPASPEMWGAADEVVARALNWWYQISRFKDGKLGKELIDNYTALVSVYDGTTLFRWLSAGSAGRRSVRRRYAETCSSVREYVQSSEFASLPAHIGELRHHRGVLPDRELWAARSADILAKLEHFQQEYGDDATQEALNYSLSRSSGLSDELSAKVRRVNLDLSLVRRQLRGYQEIGAKFAVAVGGGLLGDEMGLGKTTQALAAIAHCVSAERRRHHIVVCPASLLGNWQREVNEVLHDVPSFVYHGGTQKRDVAFRSWQAEGGILLSPYHLDPLVHDLVGRFGFLVIDEAHAFKDPASRRATNIARFRNLADRILLMTGTPLVNSEADMINLVGIANTAAGARLARQFGAVSNIRHHADAFRFAVSDYYLRRDQHEVDLELPPLTVADVPIELSEAEIRGYRAAVGDGHLERMRIAASAGVDGESSSKGQALLDIIVDAKNEGKKVLVFSQHLRTLEMVKKLVDPDCYLVHGGVPRAEADRRERQFADSDGFAVLAGQIQMTGEGKNFHMASVVVLMEPQYTSVREAQAMKRAHRMGQTEHVVCHRLVAQGTIDEWLVELVGLKAELVNSLANVSDLATELDKHNRESFSESEVLRMERKRLGFS